MTSRPPRLIPTTSMSNWRCWASRRWPRADGAEFGDIVSSLVAQYREKERLLANHLCPADQRIQTFLYDYLQDVPVPKLPLRTLRPGPARPGARAVAAGGPRRISFRASSIPTASSRACCTTRAATAAPPRAFSTSPKAACRFPTTSSACPRPSSARCSAWPSTRPVSCCACLSPPPSRSRRSALSRCCCGRWSARKCPGFIARKDHGNPVLRAGQPGQQPGFRRKHFRQRRRPRPAGERRRRWTRNIGPATPAASSSRRI